MTEFIRAEEYFRKMNSAHRKGDYLFLLIILLLNNFFHSYAIFKYSRIIFEIHERSACMLS